MTISTSIASKTYDGDGMTTEFSTIFSFFTAADIEVIERDIATGVEMVKLLTTDYTVTGGNGAIGTVHANVAPANTVSWTIRRILAEIQETDLPVAGSLPSTAIEQMVDRSVMMIQKHSGDLNRTLTFPKTDSSSLDATLPNSVDRASKFLTFDSEGNPAVQSGDPIDSGFANGSAANPSVFFTGDDDTGFYRIGPDEVGLSLGGSLVYNFASGQLSGPAGSASAPAVSFIVDPDTGFYRSVANTIGFAAGGSNVATLDSNGLTIVGGQIAFPATQNASANANTLDDYEEGTWTPILTDGTNNATLSTAVGRYTKVGRIVHTTATVTLSSVGSVSGDVKITGLPFTSVNATGMTPGTVAAFAGGLSITAGESVGGLVQVNSTEFDLTIWDSTGGTSGLSNSELTDTSSIRISISYEAA